MSSQLARLHDQSFSEPEHDIPADLGPGNDEEKFVRTLTPATN
jgi:hypothetical protein